MIFLWLNTDILGSNLSLLLNNKIEKIKTIIYLFPTAKNNII